MKSINIEELIKRIARLSRQTRELEEYIRKLETVNEKLAADNEKLSSLIEKQPPLFGGEAEGKGKLVKSLKFNMATVLFADIHGFSKLVEGMDSSAVMDELDEILFKFDSILCTGTKLKR